MRSATRVVHVMRCNNLVLDSKMIECHHIINCLAFKSVEILHRKYIILIPFEFEPRPIRSDTFYMAFVKQIVNPFFVDLKITAVNCKLLLSKILLLLN